MHHIYQKSLSNAIAFLLFLCIITLCLSQISLSQTAVTSLHGAVMDATGAVAPNVEITLTNSASGFAQSRKSSGDGEYSFQQIPPGKYALTAKASGFAQQ